MDARGKFGEHGRSVRVAPGAAESNSSFLSAILTSQVHPQLDVRTTKSMNQLFYDIASGNAGEKWTIISFNTEIVFFSAGCRSSISLSLKYESVRCWFTTQSLVTIKIKKERGKKNEKEKKRNNNRSHDWTKKAPKPCEVLLCKAEWINETAPKWTSENNFLKKSSNY